MQRTWFRHVSGRHGENGYRNHDLPEKSRFSSVAAARYGLFSSSSTTLWRPSAQTLTIALAPRGMAESSLTA